MSAQICSRSAAQPSSCELAATAPTCSRASAIPAMAGSSAPIRTVAGAGSAEDGVDADTSTAPESLTRPDAPVASPSEETRAYWFAAPSAAPGSGTEKPVKLTPSALASVTSKGFAYVALVGVDPRSIASAGSIWRAPAPSTPRVICSRSAIGSRSIPRSSPERKRPKERAANPSSAPQASDAVPTSPCTHSRSFHAASVAVTPRGTSSATTATAVTAALGPDLTRCLSRDRAEARRPIRGHPRRAPGRREARRGCPPSGATTSPRARPAYRPPRSRSAPAPAPSHR